jgi:(p)ppGpp synthase/HD superfamily hydrolase
MTFSPDRYVMALEFAARRHVIEVPLTADPKRTKSAVMVRMPQSIPGSEMPYVVHVASVAAEVIAALPATPLADPELAVMCALLHDTIEDTETTHAHVAAAFGAKVADGVQALSKNGALPKGEQMADSLRRIKLQSYEVWVVKLADRIVNLATPPDYWTREKRVSYRDEAIVIADALGAASAALDARIREKVKAYAAYFDVEPRADG